MITSRLAASVALLGVLSTVAFAGIRGPGKYSGVVVYDRWDGCTLYSGIYVMHVSESIKEQLRKHAGKCIEIDAKQVDQPKNPGDGLISEAVYLGPAPTKRNWVPLDGLALRAEPSFTSGERPSIKLTLRNSGDKDVKIFASEFAPTLLVRKPKDQRFFHPSDGPSYPLITRQAFRVGDEKARTSGSGFHHGGKGYRWQLDAAVPETFVLKSGEERAVTISFDLPKDDYDFVAGYGGGVHEEKCLASKLVAFDVDEDGKGTVVNVKGR